MTAALEPEGQPRAAVIFRVNGEKSPTVYEGEPIRLELEVIRTEGGRVNRLNLPVAGLAAFVSVLEEEGGGWSSTPWKPTLLTEFSGASEVELGPSAPLRLELGVDPNEVSSEGKVSLKVSVNLSRSEKVESDVVVVDFRREKLSEGTPGYSDRAFGRARFFLDRGDWETALDEARRLLAVDPHSVDAMILMGDALEEAGELSEALAAYQKAYLEIHSRSREMLEEPALLITKIGSVQDKLLNP